MIFNTHTSIFIDIRHISAKRHLAILWLGISDAAIASFTSVFSRLGIGKQQATEDVVLDCSSLAVL